MTTEAIRPAVRRHQPWYKVLYVQVLIAIALGILVGYFYPHLGTELKPLGDGFIALIKMMIAPGDLLYRGARHFLDGGFEARRPGRPEGADLFRGGLDGGAGDRPDRRRSAAARRRLQHRS